mmetsp:Transcript_74076/g.133539  ORF Transcript_74076/g.133539 Transcript_74076/m.133539 type:complete len:244 (-) Transcript_74076:106-837(-)
MPHSRWGPDEASGGVNSAREPGRPPHCRLGPLRALPQAKPCELDLQALCEGSRPTLSALASHQDARAHGPASETADQWSGSTLIPSPKGYDTLPVLQARRASGMSQATPGRCAAASAGPGPSGTSPAASRHPASRTPRARGAPGSSGQARRAATWCQRRPVLRRSRPPARRQPGPPAAAAAPSAAVRSLPGLPLLIHCSHLQQSLGQQSAPLPLMLCRLGLVPAEPAAARVRILPPPANRPAT